MSFDSKTAEQLKYYVYALIDPRSSEVFYIGKGKGNRVFAHVDDAISNEAHKSDKLECIREIRKSGKSVEHIIVRHGLTEEQSLRIESVLIDFSHYLKDKDVRTDLANIAGGHHAELFGLMTANELERKYNAPPLTELHHKVIIININKSYDKGKGMASIYDSTKESWKIHESRHKTLEYALAEYRGIIVGVFKIQKWYRAGERWGFDGEEAESNIKDIYLNKSIAHTKKKGAANPIRYRL